MHQIEYDFSVFFKILVETLEYLYDQNDTCDQIGNSRLLYQQSKTCYIIHADEYHEPPAMYVCCVYYNYALWH